MTKKKIEFDVSIEEAFFIFFSYLRGEQKFENFIGRIINNFASEEISLTTFANTINQEAPIFRKIDVPSQIKMADIFLLALELTKKNISKLTAGPEIAMLNKLSDHKVFLDTYFKINAYPLKLKYKKIPPEMHSYIIDKFIATGDSVFFNFAQKNNIDVSSLIDKIDEKNDNFYLYDTLFNNSAFVAIFYDLFCQNPSKIINLAKKNNIKNNQLNLGDFLFSHKLGGFLFLNIELIDSFNQIVDLYFNYQNKANISPKIKEQEVARMLENLLDKHHENIKFLPPEQQEKINLLIAPGVEKFIQNFRFTPEKWQKIFYFQLLSSLVERKDYIFIEILLKNEKHNSKFVFIVKIIF